MNKTILFTVIMGLILIPTVNAGLLMTVGTIKLNVGVGNTSNTQKIGYAISNVGNIANTQTMMMYATGEGSKYLNFQDTFTLEGKNCTDYNIKYKKTYCNGDLKFLNVSATIPSNYSGNKTMKADIYVKSIGTCKTTSGFGICIVIQMKKAVLINVGGI